MELTTNEVMQYIEEEDIKFIRLAFCDVTGVQKNISVMSGDIERVLKHGLPINASYIKGFGKDAYSDLFLHPDPSTTTLLPWRPENGRVVRMFCDITFQDGKPFPNDTRKILQNSIAKAADKGLTFKIGSRMEFYLFKTDEEGNPTQIPLDNAGYMDIAPADKGENIRREICLTLERMGIVPVNSHHEAGPGQNEIDFTSSDPLTAADQASTFMMVVKTIAAKNGLYADFSPKPLSGRPGNGYHINFRIEGENVQSVIPSAIAGILDRITDTMVFFNPTEESYRRLGEDSSPRYISWSSENRGQLIRIPPAEGSHHYAQLRSPDAGCNPYLAYSALIEMALDGISRKLELGEAADIDVDLLGYEDRERFKMLPASLEEARVAAASSDFVKNIFEQSIIDCYCKG
ncbi:MAG: glutamine synthetase [Clostridiales bacterium]|nr:glutamine synthetase [Clostridiales bacterium]MBO4579516.1 glutamine synthetase [Clostridiales bacterium]